MLFTAALSIVAESLFALQTDDRANSFVVTRGEAFYMQVKCAISYLLFASDLPINRVRTEKILYGVFPSQSF